MADDGSVSNDDSMSDDEDPVETLCLKFVSATFGNVPNCIEVFKDLDGSLVDGSSVNAIEAAHRRLCPDAQLGAGRTSRRDTPLKLRQVYDAAFSRLYEGLGLTTVEEKGNLIETIKRIKRGMPYDVSREDQILLNSYISHLLPFCVLCREYVSIEVANYGCSCATVVCAGCYTNDPARVHGMNCPTCRAPPPQAFVGVMPHQVPVDDSGRERSPTRQRTGNETVAQEQGAVVTPEVIASQQEMQALRQENYRLMMAGQSLEQAHAQLQATVLQGDASPEPSSLRDQLAYANAVREQALEVKRLRNAEVWQKAEARAINRDNKVAAGVLAQVQSDVTDEEVNLRAQELRPSQRRGQQAAPSTSRRVDQQSLEAMLEELDLL